MTKKNNKIEEEIAIESTENTVVEEKKAKTTTRRKRTVKPQETKVEEVKENNNDIDVDDILSVKKYKKKALSFYQDKSVADELTARAKASEKKNSEALNLILERIIDLDSMTCKIDIDEKKEEKIANTFKVDERIISVLNKEADSRNMSVNEYLNKVLKIVLKLG